MGHIAIPPPPFPLTAPFLEAEARAGRLYRSEHGGLLPDNEFWRYLEERWSLDPARFDHWHPRIGPWLAEDYHLRHEPPTSTLPPAAPQPVLTLPSEPAQAATPPKITPPTEPQQVETPPPVVTPPPIEPPPPEIPPSNGSPPSGGSRPLPPPINSVSGDTPEPASWILLATAVVAGFVVARFRK